jgi:hypothetical protein
MSPPKYNNSSIKDLKADEISSSELKRTMLCRMPMAHACNPSYSGTEIRRTMV